MALPEVILHSAQAPERLLDHVRELVPEMEIGKRLTFRPPGEHDDSGQASWLEREGYAILPPGLSGCPRDEAVRRDALADAILRLVQAGLPAVFAYLFDEAWLLGESLRARVGKMLGTSYLLAADGWAWVVPPGSGRGWGPHRDDGRLLDRRAPERVNVWMALTDATAERACIYVVPLDEDPAYLRGGPTSSWGQDKAGADNAPLANVRAVPVSAGTAIAWNANLLHWGGACTARAAGPRIAISYTAIRTDAASRLGNPLMTEASFAPLGRVDLVATLIKSYEEKGLPDVSPEIAAWAAATCSLQAQVEALSGRRGTAP